MTNKTLSTLIKRLNEGNTTQFVFRMLTDHVGRGFMRLRDGNSLWRVYDTFFVFDGTVCVGLVLNMSDDIHAYTRSKHRRNGHMRAAFSEVIFPSLANDGLEKKRVTVKSQGGAQLLRSLNLSPRLGKELLIDLKRYRDQISAPTPQAIPPRELRRVEGDLRSACQLIQFAAQTIELWFRIDHPPVKQLSNLRDKLDKLRDGLLLGNSGLESS